LVPLRPASGDPPIDRSARIRRAMSSARIPWKFCQFPLVPVLLSCSITCWRRWTMIRRVLLGSMLAAGVGVVAIAGHPATFVLRRGERVSGELGYKGGTSYTLNGRDSPSGDIALIEFVPGPPPQAELQQVPGVDANPNELERHVFVTRGGELIFGKIYRISEDGNVFTYDRREGGR